MNREWKKGESRYLLVLELDEERVVCDDLVALVLATCEELGEGEPLAGHLVAVVGVHELVVVHAVGRVPLYAAAGRLAGVEREDVVEQRLPRGREPYRLGWVRVVVVRRRRLADFKVLAGKGGVVRQLSGHRASGESQG